MRIRFQKAWKVYFWFSLVVLAAGLPLEFISDATDSSEPDRVVTVFSYVIEIVALFCLYGFAWQIGFGKRMFWAVFFFVSLAFFGYTILDAMLLDVEEVLSSGVFVISLLVFMVLIFLPQFVANYLYAFRSRHLWAKAS